MTVRKTMAECLWNLVGRTGDKRELSTVRRNSGVHEHVEGCENALLLHQRMIAPLGTLEFSSWELTLPPSFPDPLILEHHLQPITLLMYRTDLNNRSCFINKHLLKLSLSALRLVMMTMHKFKHLVSNA